MAMGIVKSTDFDKELAILNPTAPVKVVEIEKGRGNTNEVPETLRKVVAEEAIKGASNKELAEVFDISQSSVSAYKNGATSTASYREEEKSLKKHIVKVKSGIADSARSKIVEALSHITGDKLKLSGVRDISGVAKDMAVIMEKMEGVNNERANIQQVIVYAPRMKEEDDYNVIDVPA